LQHRLDRRAQPLAVDRVDVERRLALAFEVRRQRERDEERVPGVALAPGEGARDRKGRPVLDSSFRIACAVQGEGVQRELARRFGLRRPLAQKQEREVPGGFDVERIGAERARLQRQRFRRAAAACVLRARRLAEALRLARRDRQAGERVAAIAADRGGGGADLVVAGARARSDRRRTARARPAARRAGRGAAPDSPSARWRERRSRSVCCRRRAAATPSTRPMRSRAPATSADNAGLATTASADGDAAAMPGAATALGEALGVPAGDTLVPALTLTKAEGRVSPLRTLRRVGELRRQGEQCAALAAAFDERVARRRASGHRPRNRRAVGRPGARAGESAHGRRRA
jgi:hypothetical protein